MSAADRILWAYLALDLLEAEAALRLPLPPRMPREERATVRPRRAS